MQTTKAIFRITTHRTSQAGEIGVNKGVDRLIMCIKHLSPLPALTACLVLMVAGPVTAQTFTTLHSFTAAIGHTNTDGIYPQAGLILSGNTLYGTAYWGGRTGNGTVFAVNIDGTGFTNIYSFTGGSDGAEPAAGLILSGNTLYGTASSGGSSHVGTVFAVKTDGTVFTNLYGFMGGSDGANPQAGLILSGNTLYGTTSSGGSSLVGTVFAVNTDGTGFTNLHTFTFFAGAGPDAGLITNSSGNILYGTAYYGGSSDLGTVFAVHTDGTGFTNLYSFTGASDGAEPDAGLILSGNTLYGTASSGGSSNVGTVFAVHTDGTGFTNLYSFTGGSDGANPQAGLILSGNTLYGTAYNGGSSGRGTVFAVHTDGTGFTNLYNFTGGSDGAEPAAGLILSGNTLYGTAEFGGSSGNGTVFSLSLLAPPQLTITPSGDNVVLTWPTNAAGFTLEFAINLVSPTVWNTNSTAPAIINGQYTVTNPITGALRFFRLSK